MRIIIVGDGKMGSTFAQRLSKAGHDVTIIDKRATALQHTIESLDIMAIEGNGTTLEIQREAGVEQADLLIAATNTDEQNLLTCLIAKRAGAKHTIARVRSPEYVKEISLIQEDLGLSLTINPELACATEMARVLRFPSAVKIDTFTGGRVEILKHCLSPNSPLVGIRLSELSRFKASVLICAVERGKEVFIPNGSFQLAAGDRISIVAQPRDASLFFRRIGAPTSPVRQIMLLGGGRIAYYLAAQMADFGADVKIIEQDYAVCRNLAEALPNVTVHMGTPITNQSIFFNVERVTDVRIRQALLYGIDRQTILSELVHGNGEIVDGFLCSASPYYDASLGVTPYDPEKAAQLIQEAVADGASNRLEWYVNSGDATFVQAASFIAAMFQELGLTIDIKTVDLNTLMGVANNGTFDVMSVEYTYAPVDPYTDVSWLLSADGWTRYSNEEVNNALVESQSLTDVEEIRARYLLVDQYMQQDVPMMSAYIISSMGATSNRLLNATPNVFGTFINVNEWDIAE